MTPDLQRNRGKSAAIRAWAYNVQSGGGSCRNEEIEQEQRAVDDWQQFSAGSGKRCFATARALCAFEADAWRATGFSDAFRDCRAASTASPRSWSGCCRSSRRCLRAENRN